MKKVVILIIFFAIFNLFSFGQEQEEVDFLLFLPNSSNQFADESGARTQLDNIARYLRTKTLTEAQIYVYGYAADAANDIDPEVLSRDRALYVISELQKRGIPQSHFTAPVGHGSVDLWGNNANENTRSPNRRVRILFDDIVITPEVVLEAEEEISAYEAEWVYQDEPEIFDYEDAEYMPPIEENVFVSSESDRFNWWWLLLLLLPLLLLLWPKRKIKKPQAVASAPAPKPGVTASVPEPIAAAPAAEPVVAAAHVSEPVVAAAPVRPAGGEPKYYRLTEEEIRNLAYKLFEERNHQHGYDETDWHSAISMLFAKYEAEGYIVLWP